VNIVTGTYDEMLEAVLTSGEHLLSFLIDKISTIPGFKRTETSHVLQVVKRACDWVVPPTGPNRPTAGPAGASGRPASSRRDRCILSGRQSWIQRNAPR
jgi:hypothetical protein